MTFVAGKNLVPKPAAAMIALVILTICLPHIVPQQISILDIHRQLVIKLKIVTSPKQFLLEVRSELGKVIWPTRREAIRLTGTVIGVSVAVGIFIGALDFIFTKLMGLLLVR